MAYSLMDRYNAGRIPGFNPATSRQVISYVTRPTSPAGPPPPVLRWAGTASLTPGYGVAPVTPWNPHGTALGQNTSGGLGGLANAGCGLINDARARAVCMALAGVFLPGGGGGPNVNPAAFPELIPGPAACPDGYKLNARGACEVDDLLHHLPGDIGLTDVVWSPTNGYYGAGYTAMPVQNIRRVCPKDHVLGKDGVCYLHLAKGHRAHNPGTKPFLTGGDVNVIRRAKRLQKKFKRLRSGKGALFAGGEPRRCAPKRKK